LMLLKPSGAVAHTGGKLFGKQDKYYRLVHDWIKSGATLNLDGPTVTSVELLPKNPILGRAADRQQMRVVATYDNGDQRDVTREAFIDISDTEIGTVNGSVITASRRGESPVVARYEGAFTATTLTVMGDRDGFEWESPASWGTVDELVSQKWQRMKIRPSGLCTDAEFIRRVYLDLTGLPPTADQVRAFLADETPAREKRDALVDALIGSPEFVDHWANKWADLLQVNRKYLGVEGAKSFRQWIRGQVESNRPYNEFAYEILTASGSNRENPAASYFKIHRDPQATMENTTHLFLATRFNCNKCHDHPFERWTQDQYYETAAYFARVKLEKDPKSGDKRIGGSAVESAKPLYEIVKDAKQGDVKHDRTGQVTEPEFPFECNHDCAETATRRERLASWITSPDNPYFATSYVNRLWGYLMGVGLIEPLDDIRAGNPPSNPALLEHLRREFVESGFDTRKVLAKICKSRTYQLSVATNEYNQDDKINYSHAKARRLPAEVLFDSIHFVTGSPLMIPGVAAGTRAAALPDSGAKLPSGFLSTLGRPVRESACECERGSDLQLGSVLALVSGPDLSRAIHNQSSEIKKMVDAESDDRKVINELFMRILNRPATEQEADVALETLKLVAEDHDRLVKQRDERTEAAKVEMERKEKVRVDLMAQVNQSLAATIKEVDPELAKREKEHADKLRVLLVQVDTAHPKAHQRMFRASQQAKNQADLILWPECALGNY
ncbi:MAG: DUF1549 and DUF1553 domain-containing protein, partial [Planctomycetota bacterium]